MIYPQILTSLSGNPVTSKAVWEKHRRDEILMLFENFVYGVAPIDRPEDLFFETEEIMREENVVQKKVTIGFSAMKFRANVFIPKGNTEKLPAYLVMLHEDYVLKYDVDSGLDFDILPITEILRRGYAVVTMPLIDICPDMFCHKDHSEKRYCDGIFTKISYLHRPNSWSIISAWAWGASRVMDYLETDRDIDSERVIIAGHSRCGKTALWAAALDQRFAMSVSNNSGCTGASFTRGKSGEHVKRINEFFHWFSENYEKYNDDEDMLPVDQHMLLALIAPRPLYVTSSSEDDWADPSHELLSCRLAGDAYALYGEKGVVVPPSGAELDTPYHDGKIGYHVKTGEHSITPFDWRLIMDFSDKYVKRKEG